MKTIKGRFGDEITTRKGYRKPLTIHSGPPHLVGVPVWKIVRGKGKLDVAPDGRSAYISNAVRAVIHVSGDAL